jgi:hypothetical protein
MEMKMNKASLAILSVLALSAAPFAAYAESGAGMVTKASGANVAPYSEIVSGSTIALGQTGSVTFVHYDTCREVTVTGGNVTVNETDYQATGSVSETQQACPERVRIASKTASSGGLVIRGMSKVTELGSYPSLALTGKRASAVSGIRFVAEDKSVVAGAVSKGKVTIPAELKVGGHYDMQLIGQGKTQLEMPVQIVAGAASPLVVLTVD